MRVLWIAFFLPLCVYAQYDIQVLDKKELSELINNREGKVLVLNIWATWCVPCREEIPDLMQLHNKYSAKIDVIGISVDYPDEISARILPFVKQQKINYQLYVNNLKDEELINFFLVKWNGAIPVTFIYDKTGKRIFFLEGKKSYSELEKTVSSLIR